MKREIFVLVVIYLDDRTDLREEFCNKLVKLFSPLFNPLTLSNNNFVIYNRGRQLALDAIFLNRFYLQVQVGIIYI
jgi:hypothetical protein